MIVLSQTGPGELGDKSPKIVFPTLIRHLTVKRPLLGYGCSKGRPLTVGFRYAWFMELIFEIREAEEGGFYARALGHGIFTQGETWDELRGNVLEAVSLHFDDASARPRLVQMHYVKDELIPLEAA